VIGLLLLLADASSPNLVLVTIDTLRADRVGAYGHASAETPALDRLAREGVLVEDAVVQVPQTRPSHVSIFTGRQPHEHGIRDNFSPPLDPRFPTLATRLRDAGYAAGGFIGAYPVSRDSGLDRGFEVFDDPFTGRRARSAREERSERRAGEVVDAALVWLEKARPPFFAWVHLFDPHHPYDPPAPYRQRFAKDAYDGEVAYSDSQVARLLDWLDRSGRAAQTLVVVTSDHGEGLGDHGEDEHLFFVYDSTLKVPLLLRWPRELPAGARIGGQFRSVDLLPTLLELLGLPALFTSGASRAAEVRAARAIPDNESYAESLYAQLHFGHAPLRALRGEGWKYIDAPRPELYHLRSDPKELRNRLDDRATVAAAMQQRLKSYDAGTAPAAQAALDPEASERLAALGYVGGGFFSGPPSGADPKDKIAAFQAERRQVGRALALFREGKHEAVVRTLEPLRRPTRNEKGQVVERKSFNVSFYLGRSLLELRRFAAAVGPLREAVALSPSSTSAHVHLVRALAGAGRRTEALAAVERGLLLAPGNADLHQLRGRLLLQQGDAGEARLSLERAEKLDPENALVHVDLSSLLRGQGQAAAALAEADAAVQLAPTSPEAHVARGLALGASGREADAQAAFREALRHDADDPDALFFLGATELRAGRPEAAAALLERLLKKAPAYPGAGDMLATARRQGGGPLGEGQARIRLLRVGTKDAAEEAARRAASGEDFAALARALSADPSAGRGGDLGVVTIADLAEPLRSAVAGLAPGEVGPIVATADGFVVVKRER
jgi:arylsulfatase A-like enzyme/predicted Zn-dependent protease